MYKLIHGQDTFLSLRRAKDLVQTLSEDLKVEPTYIDAEITDPIQTVTLLQSNNLFRARSVFLIKRLYRNKSKELLIQSVLENNSDTDSTYIFWEDQKVNKTTKYFKHFGKDIELFEKGNKRSVTTWLKKYIDNNQLQCDSTTLSLLASRCNYDTERIFNILEKISLSEKKVIDTNLVLEMSTDTLETYAWDLTDAVNRKDKQSALTIFENLLSQQVDPNLLLAMLSNNLKTLTQIHILLKNGMNQKEVAKHIGTHPFVVSKLISRSREIKGEEIKSIFSKLTSLDLGSKKGEIDLTLGITVLLSRIN